MLTVETSPANGRRSSASDVRPACSREGVSGRPSSVPGRLGRGRGAERRHPAAAGPQPRATHAPANSSECRSAAFRRSSTACRRRCRVSSPRGRRRGRRPELAVHERRRPAASRPAWPRRARAVQARSRTTMRSRSTAGSASREEHPLHRLAAVRPRTRRVAGGPPDAHEPPWVASPLQCDSLVTTFLPLSIPCRSLVMP